MMSTLRHNFNAKPIKIPSFVVAFLCETEQADSKIYVDKQKVKKSQGIYERKDILEEESRRICSTWYKDLL